MLTKLSSDQPPVLRYRECRYDGCRLSFRGPQVDFDGPPFVAVLGGSESFGKFVETPFTERLGEWLGLPVANLSVANAGLTLFTEEPWLLNTASKAKVTVLQVLGAQNMSNRLYSVHARRNDRFVSFSPELRKLYPDVDFADIHFTGHLLDTLAAHSATAFDTLVEELKQSWVHRMRRLLNMISGDVILLWMSNRNQDQAQHAGEPLFVDRMMVNDLSDLVAGMVEVLTEEKDCETDLHGAEAARMLPGPAAHQRAAERLATEISRLAEGAGPHGVQASA